MSPNVVREKGYLVIVLTNDHPPAHVHVKKGGKEAKVSLVKPIKVLKNRGFSAGELQEIIQIVRQYYGHCWKVWHEVHGE